MVLALPLWVHSTEVFYRSYQRGLVPLGQADLGRTRPSQSAGRNRELTFLFETGAYLSSNHRLLKQLNKRMPGSFLVAQKAASKQGKNSAHSGVEATRYTDTRYAVHLCRVRREKRRHVFCCRFIVFIHFKRYEFLTLAIGVTSRKWYKWTQKGRLLRKFTSRDIFAT